jgi:Zn-dependent membrane protease YugP
MHPVVVVIPAAALILGPRLWVRHVLKQYNRGEGGCPVSAAELARALLDSRQLHSVKVESTDIGDHYDHTAKAVRLNREKYNRKTLAAVTTAAHEVAHALQDAEAYAPYVWRTRLVKVAQVALEVGSVLLLAVPVTVLVTRRPLPPRIVGTTALSVMGTGVIAQLAALPSELDASFGRALPMLRDEDVISDGQVHDARKILVACSLTYIASSLAAVLSLWPWLGRAHRMTLVRPSSIALLDATQASSVPLRGPAERPRRAARSQRRPGNRKPPGLMEDLVRQVGKPLIRGWFRFKYRL